MTKSNITILGAGVIGLTTALQLSEDPKNSITIVAKDMPGDYSIEYASPWAGANYLPVSKAGTAGEIYERGTWPELARLARELPEAGIHFQNAVIYNRKKDVGSATGEWFKELLKTDPWYKDLVPDFRILPQNELPPDIDSATSFTSVCINTALYLPWLASKCLKNGAIIRRAIVNHVSDAADLHHSGIRADVVVNCTGLSSAKLAGVEDPTVFPARGQIVVVRNDPGIMSAVSGTDDGSDEATYIMHRAAGGGTVLGGSYQKGSWEPQTDLDLASRIIKRCVDLCPALTAGNVPLSIIRHGVGLRPVREDGPRIEKEQIRNVWVIHNYGHGGYGYQTSYGTAKAAVRLVEEALGAVRAKL